MSTEPSQQVDLYARGAESFREPSRTPGAMMGGLVPDLLLAGSPPLFATNLMPVVVQPRLCPGVVCGGVNHICHPL